MAREQRLTLPNHLPKFLLTRATDAGVMEAAFSPQVIWGPFASTPFPLDTCEEAYGSRPFRDERVVERGTLCASSGRPALNSGPVQDERMDLSRLTDEQREKETEETALRSSCLT